MSALTWKLGGKDAREAIAALSDTAPWYMIPRLTELLASLTERGIEIRIQKASRKHTSPQQHYYWFCVGLFAKHYGTTPDDMHNVILMEAFGSKDVLGQRGAIYPVPKQRSSNLSVEDYGHLIETLQRCAAFNGCVLPDPMEVSA